MLKLRIAAALIAIVLTLLTIYWVPRIVYFYNGWMAGLTQDQRTWFNWSQVAIGVLLAAYGFWRWKKKKSQTEK